MDQKSFWIKGTIFLTLAGLISRVLGMIYRVPLQNLAGDEGLYVYQQIYPILSIALMLSIYSFPSAIAEVTSNRTRKNEPGILLLFIIFGLSIFSLIYLWSDNMALWMGDPHLTSSIRLAGGMFLLIPLTSYFRGTLQGLNQTKYVALSQIIEQFIRVVFIILFTLLIVRGSESIYVLGNYAAIATMAGTAVAAMFLFFIYRKLKLTFSFTMPSKKIIRVLIVGSIVYSLTYLLHLLLQFVDIFTMVKQLQAFGFSFEEAKVEKGIYDRGHAIIQLGLVLGSSLALAFIPTLQKSESYSKKDETFALKVTYSLALPATAGLIVIMPLFNSLLYENRDGTEALQIMMVLIFLLSFVILFSVLLGKYQNRIGQFIWIFIMVGLKIILNVFLIPIYGIVGASLASVISVSILCIALFVTWKVKSNHRINMLFIMKGFISTALMTAIVFIVRHSLLSYIPVEHRFSLLLVVLLLCLIGAVIYIGLVIVFRMFSKEELKQLLLR